MPKLTVDGTEIEKVLVDGVEMDEVFVDGTLVFRATDILYLNNTLVATADGEELQTGSFALSPYDGIVGGADYMYGILVTLNDEIASSSFDNPTSKIASWVSPTDGVIQLAVDGSGNVIYSTSADKVYKYDVNGNQIWEISASANQIVAFSDDTFVISTGTAFEFYDANGVLVDSKAAPPTPEIYGTADNELWYTYNDGSPSFTFYVGKYDASRNLVFEVDQGKADFAAHGDCDSQGDLIVGLSGGSDSQASIHRFRNSDGNLIATYTPAGMGDSENANDYRGLFVDNKDNIVYWKVNYDGNNFIRHIEVLKSDFSGLVWSTNIDDYANVGSLSTEMALNVGKRARRS